MERLDRTVETLYIRQTSNYSRFYPFDSSLRIVFLPHYTDYSLRKPYNAMSTRSTIGQQGVTSPALALRPQGTAKTPSADTTSILRDVSADVLTSMLTPKPAWTHMPLYTDPTNEATTYANSNPTATGVSYIARMGKIPVAEWFGDWNLNVTSDVNSYVTAGCCTTIGTRALKLKEDSRT